MITGKKWGGIMLQSNLCEYRYVDFDVSFIVKLQLVRIELKWLAKQYISDVTAGFRLIIFRVEKS